MRILHKGFICKGPKLRGEKKKQDSPSSWPQHLLEPQNAIILLPNEK